VSLIPAFGRKRLDAIKSEDVQRLKAQLEVKSPKTVNNILAVLSVLLKKAVEWEVIDRMPCTVKLLPVGKGAAAFHDFDLRADEAVQRGVLRRRIGRVHRIRVVRTAHRRRADDRSTDVPDRAARRRGRTAAAR
jgi:hypothetical protein